MNGKVGNASRLVGLRARTNEADEDREESDGEARRKSGWVKASDGTRAAFRGSAIENPCLIRSEAGSYLITLAAYFRHDLASKLPSSPLDGEHAPKTPSVPI